MSALICGSMAYDTIMAYPEAFKNHILPDKIHILNVCFEVPELRREFGGTAGNIAYNLKLLGSNGFPMATVGADFKPYAEWMDKHGVSREYIKEVPGTYTAQAFITTDTDNNQITAFHPGAMQRAHEQTVPTDKGMTLGVIAPDGREGMLQHAHQFYDAGIPFLFDPGQGLPLFSGKELKEFIDMATWVAVNDYESQMLEQKTGLAASTIADQVAALIVTWGAKGSVIYSKHRRTRGQRRGSTRSHRLWRRLSRGPHLRPHARQGLGDHREHRLAHGRHQDRVPRHPEPPFQPRGIRAAV